VTPTKAPGKLGAHGFAHRELHDRQLGSLAANPFLRGPVEAAPLAALVVLDPERAIPDDLAAVDGVQKDHADGRGRPRGPALAVGARPGRCDAACVERVRELLEPLPFQVAREDRAHDGGLLGIYGERWEGGVDPSEDEALATFLHVICLPAAVCEFDPLFLRLLIARAREVPELAWIALDPLGAFLFRDDDGRAMSLIAPEYGQKVGNVAAQIAEATGACVTPVAHMTRASRRSQHEGGEAARAVRADPFGTEFLRNGARFLIGLEPVATANDLQTLRLGTERTWLRLATGKSNYGETDIEIILERVAGAVRIADMSAPEFGRPDFEALDAPIEKTPGDLGFVVGETVSKTTIARKLMGTGSKPNSRQQERADRLARQWAKRGWARPDGSRGWRILALGPPVAEAGN